MPKYGTDYSKTVIDLNNSIAVGDLLLAWGEARKRFDEANAAYTDATESLPEAIAHVKAGSNLAEAHAAVKEAITRLGSYQDIAEGLYALKQRRQSISYDPVKVRNEFPQFADAVIEETANGTKLHGLLKGGLVTEEQLERVAIRTSVAPAYIIDVVEKPQEVA